MSKIAEEGRQREGGREGRREGKREPSIQMVHVSVK